jgi:glycosidase
MNVSRGNAAWRTDFAEVLPDLSDADIGGSGFAIRAYSVPASMGGDAALARLRDRLRRRGLRLLLDFVPNHVALDHPWTESNLDYFIPGTAADLAREPANFCRVSTSRGELILAHGRDPYFPGWPDSLQLNYGNPKLQDAMLAELTKVAGMCDGVRCDMAMLILPEVFQRTWGIRCEPFWPKALPSARHITPDFLFLAEVYWDLEWNLQQQGFDFAYDKRLYDRLREGKPRPVRDHLRAELDYQNRLARFLENHDEPRAAATFQPGKHQAAAVLTFLSPGMRFFHQGQLEGFKKHIAVHLVRGPDEPVDAAIKQFYDRLLSVLRRPELRGGRWQLLECRPAWQDNWTWDDFIAYSWEGDGARLLVAVNFAANPSQCFVTLACDDFAGKKLRLRDPLSDAVYERDGNDLATRGLYVDLPAWGCHVLAIETGG